MRSFAFCLLFLSLANPGEGGGGVSSAATPVDSSPTQKKPSTKVESSPQKGKASPSGGKQDAKSAAKNSISPPSPKKDDASGGKKDTKSAAKNSISPPTPKKDDASNKGKHTPIGPPPPGSKAGRLLGVTDTPPSGDAEKGAIKEQPILEKEVKADAMNDISFSLDFPTVSAFDLLFAKDMKFSNSSKQIKECDWHTVHITNIGSSADAVSGSSGAAGDAVSGSSGAAADAKRTRKTGKSLWAKLRGIPRVLGLRRSLDFRHQKVEIKSVNLRQEDSRVIVEVAGHCVKTNKKSKAEEKKAVVLTFFASHTPSESETPRDPKLNSVELPPKAAHINVGKNKTILYLNSRDGLQTSLGDNIQKKTFDRA